MGFIQRHMLKSPAVSKVAQIGRIKVKQQPYLFGVLVNPCETGVISHRLDHGSESKTSLTGPAGESADVWISGGYGSVTHHSKLHKDHLFSKGFLVLRLIMNVLSDH